MRRNGFRSNRPVRLGEIRTAEVSTGRRLLDLPRVTFRTAPDLFFGALSGGKMYVHVRRAEDSWPMPAISMRLLSISTSARSARSRSNPS